MVRGVSSSVPLPPVKSSALATGASLTGSTVTVPDSFGEAVSLPPLGVPPSSRRLASVTVRPLPVLGSSEVFL
jgi:hypothetical protein